MIEMRYGYPFRGKFKMTCAFGKKGNWHCGWHTGVDIVGIDDKSVCAIADGVVESVNAHGSSYGNHICIRHTDGMMSLYAHLASVKVKAGAKVCMGEVIGIMGKSGNASGEHLHLELHTGKYSYPAKGSTADKVKSPIDGYAWIEDHIGRDEDMNSTNENDPSAWACEAWEWAKKEKLMDGTRPKSSLTREELAVILMRLSKW